MFTTLPLWATALLLLVGIGLLALIVLTAMASDGLDDVDPATDCDHDWDGPEMAIEGGSTATCSKCGDAAINHSLRISP